MLKLLTSTLIYVHMVMRQLINVRSGDMQKLLFGFWKTSEKQKNKDPKTKYGNFMSLFHLIYLFTLKLVCQLHTVTVQGLTIISTVGSHYIHYSDVTAGL